ncbi:MAG: class I SAM-dependent methyltransferase [Anaerolineae bacterium]|nr:class I SAM-dependent methyltransferase [Anaerolineae bacterium]
MIKPTREEIISVISSTPPHPGAVVDEMALPSYLHSNSLIRWLMWRRLEYAYDLAQIQEDANVLDFGCGTGLLLPELCRVAENVYAVDIFPDYAKSMVALYDLEVSFVDDLIEIDDNSLDVILATDVLEHIDELDEYIGLFKKSSSGRAG